MDDVSSSIILLVALLIGGGYFAGAEISLASVNKIRMKSYADDGNKKAKKVLYILDNFDDALTTILIGNNIMHIGVATISTVLVTKMWGSGAVAYGTLVTTFVVFLLSEMIPKYFAKACNETFALTIASSLMFLMKILKPVSFIFSTITDFISKHFKSSAEEEPTVTEDELYDMIETAVEEGALDEQQSELIQSAVEFSGTIAKDIATPWNKVMKITSDMSPEEIVKIIKETTYSRLVVVDKNDNPIGVLQIRAYLKAYMNNKEHNPKVLNIMYKTKKIDANTPIDDLLSKMSSSKTHLVFIYEGNKVLGILTMEDILEELVGEIYDEYDLELGGVK